MARQWTTGFETQSATLEFGVNSGNIVTGTTPTMQTTIKRRGTCAARFQPSAALSYIEHQIEPGTVKRTFHRLYIRVAAFPNTDTNIYAIGQAGYFPASLRLKTDGTLLLRDSQSSTDLTGSMSLSLDRWYRVELDYTDVAGTITAGVSAFKLYVDGALIADTLCSNINGFSRVRMGVSGVAATMDYYMDDVAINDTSGSVQNGLPGPGAVVHLLPNAAGDNNLWSTTVGGTAGAANNYTRVAERTPDDSTSYNQTTATGTTTIDDFGLESASSAGIGSADIITCVQVGGRVASDLTTAASIVYRLKSQASGTVVESASVPVNNTGTAGAWSVHRGQSPRPYQLTSYTDPQDATPWTAAKLDNAQIGYRGDVSQTTVRRVSTLWALVDFVPIFALGVAAEDNLATSLIYSQAAIPLKNLVDDFNDNTIDTLLWPNSFGTISETGGRARVEVNTGFNAYSSAKAYKLQNSQVTFQPFPPGSMPETGTTEAWMQALVKSNVSGTDLGFEVQITTGTLYCFNRVGFSDPESAAYTFNATNHAWLRIREDGTNTYFDAAPDGHTWTNLRTITSPSWVADGDLEFQMIAHRSDGTTNNAEFDNVNVLFPLTFNLGVATEKNTARALDANKLRTLGFAAEENTATALVETKVFHLGVAAEESTGHAVVASKTEHLGFAAEDNTATALAVTKTADLAAAAEESTGHAVVASKTEHLGVAQELNTGHAVDANKLRTLGTAQELNTGHAVNAAHLLTAGAAHVDDAATAVVASKMFHLGVATELNTGHGVTASKLRVIGAAATEDTSGALVASKRYSVAPAHSQAAGHPVVARKTATLGAAATQDAATVLVQVVTVMLFPAAETSSGRPVTASKTAHLGTAQTVNTAHAVDHSRTFHLGVAAVDEAATAFVVTKTASVTATGEVNAATAIDYSRMFHLTVSAEENTGHGVTASKLRTLGSAQELNTAHGVVARKLRTLGVAATEVNAIAVDANKTRSIATSAVVDAARGVAASKLRTVGFAAVKTAGQPVVARKVMLLGVAREDTVVHGVRENPKRRMAKTARIVERARPITAVKQRPASTLRPGVTGPSLVPGLDGPDLIVTSTTGGS